MTVITFIALKLTAPLNLDGRLDEPVYQVVAPYTDFAYPWEPDRTPPPARAWLFHDDTYLYVSFDVVDRHIVSAPPSPAGKMAVGDHSRMELFLWDGDPASAYFGFEINPDGLTLDYKCRFHRRFDYEWMCHGLTVGSLRTPDGYSLEAAIPLETLAKEGYDLRSRSNWRAGLYRAEKDTVNPEEFHWSCIVQPNKPEIDFHIPETFGQLILQ